MVADWDIGKKDLYVEWLKRKDSQPIPWCSDCIKYHSCPYHCAGWVGTINPCYMGYFRKETSEGERW